EHRLHLPAAPADVHLRRQPRARRDTDAPRRHGLARRDRAQPSRPQREATRMARKVGSSGRLRFALVLLGFVLTASVVVLRRTYGIAGARELQAAATQRPRTAAGRRRLEPEIRIVSSRGHLQPIAEQRLQMHVPTENQVVYLTRDTGTVHAKP